MPLTFNAIFLGNSGVTLDPTEGNTTAENAGSLTGTTYGSLTNALAGNWVTFTSVNVGGSATALDQNNQAFSGGANDQAQITRNGVTTTFTFDGTSVYTGTLTYSNGTQSAPLDFVIVQMTNRDLYLVPSPTAGTATNTALAADQVRSLTLTALVGANYTGMAVDRPVISFIPCFARGTMIASANGPVAVERIAPGDRIMTADNGLQPVRWVGMRRLSAQDLASNPNLAPIRIAKGALGAGLPRRDLTVSPQHRLLVRSRIALRVTGRSEVLVAAKHLVGLPGITVAADMDRVEYWHVLFDQHEVIFAEEAPTESLYLGAQTLRAMTPDALAEIRALFPDLTHPRTAIGPAESRPLLPGRVARKLAVRHGWNEKPLLEMPALMRKTTPIVAKH